MVVHQLLKLLRSSIDSTAVLIVLRTWAQGSHGGVVRIELVTRTRFGPLDRIELLRLLDKYSMTRKYGSSIQETHVNSNVCPNIYKNLSANSHFVQYSQIP